MGDADITVYHQDLLDHAERLDDIASVIADARDAANTTTPTPDAYGRLCTMVPIMIEELQSMIIEGVDAAIASVRDTADRLRRSAMSYSDTDQNNADALNQIGN